LQHEGARTWGVVRGIHLGRIRRTVGVASERKKEQGIIAYFTGRGRRQSYEPADIGVKLFDAKANMSEKCVSNVLAVMGMCKPCFTSLNLF